MESTVQTLHTDHLGSTSVATDEDGIMIELLDYHPYGTERISWSSSSTDGSAESQKTYIGEYSDNESGLSYLNARYYDPERGQFLSQDSVYLSLGSGIDKREQVALLDPQMQNSYAYARNNPVKHTDPDGEFAFVIPLIAYGIWQAVEAGLTVMDTMNAVETLQSSDATTTEKAISVVGAVAGIVLPGGGYGSALNKVDDVVDGVKAIGGVKGARTLTPGSFAQESIPARSSARNFTREEVTKVNEIGNKNGCHTCGTKDSGTASGNFVKDHQPPTGLNQNSQPQRLLPQCISCSRQQGGTVNAIKNFFKNLSE